MYFYKAAANMQIRNQIMLVRLLERKVGVEELMAGSFLAKRLY
jgi:hypothetical protein